MILATIFNKNGELLTVYMLLISIIAFIMVLPQFFKNNKKYGLNLFWLGVLTFAMALLPIQSGDFVYYARMLQSGHGIYHLEDFYQYLWEITHNYLWWRTLIWGSCTALLILAIKRLRLNPYFSSFIFVITEFFYFGTMRNMLGYMVLFYSIIIILYPYPRKTKFLFWLIGALGLYYCLFLHRSMYLYLILLIPALIPFNKKMMRISILCFPILYGLIFMIADYFLIFTNAGEDQMQSAEYYTTGNTSATFMQTVNNIVRYASYVYLIYVVVTETSKKKIVMPYVYKFLTRYAFILIYLGSLFWGQKAGGWLFLRFTGAGELAFMFVMMYFFYKYPRTKRVKLAFSGLIYYILYNIAYIVYFNSSFSDRVNTITL